VTPQRVVVIAATARSGSTLLGAGLAATGVLGDAEEHLNQRTIDDRRREWGVPRIAMRGHAGRLRRRVSGDRTWTPTSRFTRQADATTEEWVARFLADQGHAGRGA
jgi:LPS sulfotransferase NodH